MGRNDNDESLGDAIGRMLKAYGLEDGYYAAAIATYWEELMGPAVARRTGEIKFEKGVLRIRVDSAPLRQELSYGKEQIAQRLNRKLERRLIREVEIVG